MNKHDLQKRYESLVSNYSETKQELITLQKHIELIKSQNWISTEDKKPLAYMTGLFDGKKSDEVIAKDENGKLYLATYYEGTLDGSKFEDWYDSNEYDIKNRIVSFLNIPD